MTFALRGVARVHGRPQFLEHAPHPALRARVLGYWEVKLPPGQHTLRVLPDACVDVTFDLGARTPTVYGSAPQRTATTYQRQGPSHLLGVRLAPGAAPLWLGAHATTLTEGWTRLEPLLGDDLTKLTRALHHASDSAARVELLDRHLVRTLLVRDVDDRLLKAIELTFQSGGTMPITTLAKRAAASERTLGRLFSQWVGLSPKRFARIVRFQRVLRSLEGKPDWSQLAIELGYFDQAHLINELRELFGDTPVEALATLSPP